jgi:hypothetical protein
MWAWPGMLKPVDSFCGFLTELYANSLYAPHVFLAGHNVAQASATPQGGTKRRHDKVFHEGNTCPLM